MTVKNITSFEGIKTDTGDKEVEHFMNVVCNGSTMEPLDSQYRVENRLCSTFTAGKALSDVTKCVCPTPMRECLKGYSCSSSTVNGGIIDMYSQWMKMCGPYNGMYPSYNSSKSAWAETGDFSTSKGIRTFPYWFNSGSCLGVHHKLRHLKTIQTPSFVLSFYVTEPFRQGGMSYDNILETKYQNAIDTTPSDPQTCRVVVSPCFFVRCIYKQERYTDDTVATTDNIAVRADWFAFPISWDFVNNDLPSPILRSTYRSLDGTDTNNAEYVFANRVSTWYSDRLPKYNFSACECNTTDSMFCYISIGPILAWVGFKTVDTNSTAVSGIIPDPEYDAAGGPSSVGVAPIGSSTLWYENENTPVLTALFNSPCWRNNNIYTGIGDNAYYDPEQAWSSMGWTVFTYLSEMNHSESDPLIENQKRYIYYPVTGGANYVIGPTRSTNYSVNTKGCKKFHSRNWSLTFFNQRLFALDKNSGYTFATNAGVEKEFLVQMFEFDVETTEHEPGHAFQRKSDVPNIDELGDWFDMDDDGVYRTKIWGWYGKPSSSSGLAKQIHSSDNTLYLVYDSSVDTYALSNLSDQPITMTYQNTHSPNGVFSHIFNDGAVALLFENCGLGIKVYKFNEDGSIALVSNAEMEKRLYRHCKNLQCTTYLSNGKRFVAILADDKSYAYLYDVNGGYWTEMTLFAGKNFVSFYFENSIPMTIPVNEYEDNEGHWNDSWAETAPLLNSKYFVNRHDVSNFTFAYGQTTLYLDKTAAGTAGLAEDTQPPVINNDCYITTAPSFYGSRKALTYIQVVGDNKNEDSTKTASSTTWSLSVSFDNGKTFNTAKTRIKGSEQRMDKDIEWRALGSGNNSAIKILASGIKEESQIYAINTEVK